MEILGIDRVVVMTDDMDESIDLFNDLLGLRFDEVHDSAVQGESMEISYSFPGIELMTPTADEGAVAERLAEHGPGLHALCIRVEDLDEAVAELEEKGLEPIIESDDDDSKSVFYHPAAFKGVFIQLMEYPHPLDRR